ncbi:MAG: hypothetical protein ABI772_08785 [Bacteroidota bacterium]
MKKTFEYIYYNLYVFYSKKERGDRGPLLVICFIQLFIFLSFIFLPVGLFLGKDVIKENDYWLKPSYFILMIVIILFNNFYFKHKFEMLKERYKGEPERIRKRNTLFIYLSLLGLLIIFFGSILIRDGGFVKK